MIIAGEYSFKDGLSVIKAKYPSLLEEVQEIIQCVNADSHKTKSSKEKTMPGKLLFNPISLNEDFKSKFSQLGWASYKQDCKYTDKYYTEKYLAVSNPNSTRGAFRAMDFVKSKLGIEVQFGKYAFMVYNVCAKMTIFNRLGIIDAGIEIVPIKEMADNMSTGVSYFEQFIWDLEQRGTSDIDIPVLILGIFG